MSDWQHTTISFFFCCSSVLLSHQWPPASERQATKVLRLNAFQSSTDLISRSSGFGTGSEHGMISDMTGLHVLDQHLSSYWSVCGQDPQWSVVSGGCVCRQLMDVLGTVCASTRETDILRSDQWHSSSKLSTDTQHLVHHLCCFASVWNSLWAPALTLCLLLSEKPRPEVTLNSATPPSGCINNIKHKSM